MHFMRYAVACVATSLALAPLAAAQRQSRSPAVPAQALGSAPLVATDILSWEDTDNLIETLWGPVPTQFDEHEVTLITVQAANDILPLIGDNYDFIGFWMNFKPATWWGNAKAAHYGPIKNNVTGLGTFPGADPDGTHDFHSDYGLAGSKLQGLLFFTNINSTQWQSSPSFPTSTAATRLIVNHEYEHRFGNYLPDLLDGRHMQGQAVDGSSGACGTKTHWDSHVDGQGSCLGVQEWIGSNPALLGTTYGSGRFGFNTDIVGGTFSYLDLYLMGMVSPAEVDAGMSEMRYMDDSVDCSAPYFGAISHFTMADIVASAGPRVPESGAAQKDFKTAWVIIHKPGDPPDAAEKQKLIGILNNQQQDWTFSTLGRSTMSHTLDRNPWADQGCALAGVSGEPTLIGAGDLVGGTSNAVNLSNAAPSAAAGLFLALAGAAVPFKGGTLKPFPFFDPVIVATSSSGQLPVPFVMPLGIPVGTEIWVQWAIQDAAAVKGVALSNAIRGLTP
ncbi:MAG: hypothetical protein DRQ55_08945 [Planctomycetota bacterium]|nr:MAG: hypothetical protein DRQ55_08945 [Planctomycetota bacterium]